MKIAIFGNAMKRVTIGEVAHLLEFLALREVEVYLSQELRQELNLRDYPPFPVEDEAWEAFKAEGNMIDFALSIGGDGTFLTTASIIGNKNIPIVGINCGHLGFLAEVQTDQVDVIMDQLIQGRYTIEQRSLLYVDGEGGHLSSPYALNEIAVMKSGLSSMINIEVNVNGEHLHTYEADGLVISTPTGSTAYNLSVGGPLMEPHVKAIILSPIATHKLGVRPLVIPDEWAIDLKITSRNGNYLISVDGRSRSLLNEVQLHIQKAPYTTKVVQLEEHSFIQALKDKLQWGK